MLQTLTHWFMVNWLRLTEVAETQLPNDPSNVGSMSTLTHYSFVRRLVLTLLVSITFSLPIFAQSSINNLEGLWVLTALQGNDTARVLTPAEIEKSTKNFLHDFPLTTTSLKFSGNNFTMTHHVGGVMGGTFDVQKNVLTLHVSSCSTCGSKDFFFIIRKQTPTEFLLDMFEEDEGSTSYVRLTFERNTIVNNVNQK